MSGACVGRGQPSVNSWLVQKVEGDSSHGRSASASVMQSVTGCAPRRSAGAIILQEVCVRAGLHQPLAAARQLFLIGEGLIFAC